MTTHAKLSLHRETNAHKTLESDADLVQKRKSNLKKRNF